MTSRLRPGLRFGPIGFMLSSRGIDDMADPAQKSTQPPSEVRTGLFLSGRFATAASRRSDPCCKADSAGIPSSLQCHGPGWRSVGRHLLGARRAPRTQCHSTASGVRTGSEGRRALTSGRFLTSARPRQRQGPVRHLQERGPRAPPPHAGVARANPAAPPRAPTPPRWPPILRRGRGWRGARDAPCGPVLLVRCSLWTARPAPLARPGAAPPIPSLHICRRHPAGAPGPPG